MRDGVVWKEGTRRKKTNVSSESLIRPGLSERGRVKSRPCLVSNDEHVTCFDSISFAVQETVLSTRSRFRFRCLIRVLRSHL